MSLLVLAAFAASRSTPALAVPSNDNLADAIVVGELPFDHAAESSAATNETGEPVPACVSNRPTVWYRYDASSEIGVVADTSGSTGILWIAVYHGSGLGDLTPVACSPHDGANPTAAKVYFKAVPQRTYWFQVAGPTSLQTLTVAFHVRQASHLPNDDFADAHAVTGAFSDTVYNGSATREPGEPSTAGCLGGMYHSVWYRYTTSTTVGAVAQSGGVFWTSNGCCTYESRIAVYRGTSLASLVRLGCGKSPVSFRAVPGETYYLQSGSDSGSTSYGWGMLTTSLTTYPAPANDAFSQAASVTALPYAQTYHSAGASAETGEGVQRSVWYRVTLASESVVQVTSQSASRSTLTQAAALVATGPASISGVITRADEVDSSYSGTFHARIVFRAKAGISYYVRVSEWSTDPYSFPSGLVDVRFEKVTAPVNDLVSAATMLTDPGLYESNLLNATQETIPPTPRDNSSGDIWYRVAPATATGVTIDLAGSDPAARFTISPDPWPQSGVPERQRWFRAEAGTSYDIRVFSEYATNLSSGDVYLQRGQVPLPPNDRFDEVIDVGTGTSFTHSGTLLRASRETGEPTSPCGSGPSTVWYRFTPPDLAGGVASVASSTSAAVSIFKGTSMETLQYVACHAAPRASFRAEAGESYLIQVSGDCVSSCTGSGAFTFTFATSSAPPNDSLASARNVGALPLTDAVDTAGASIEAGEPASSCGSSFQSVWYRLAPVADTGVTASVAAPFAATIALYEDTGSPWPVERLCGKPVLEFRARSGRVYFVKVGGPLSEGAPVTVSITARSFPANDDVADATTLTPGDTHEVNTDIATVEAGEPPSCPTRKFYVPLHPTVWYRFEASAAERIGIGTFGSSFDTVVAVYRGTSFENLSLVACEDDANGTGQSFAHFDATPGTTYLVQIGGRLGARGTLKVRLTSGAGAAASTSGAAADAYLSHDDDAIEAGARVWRGPDPAVDVYRRVVLP